MSYTVTVAALNVYGRWTDVTIIITGVVLPLPVRSMKKRSLLTFARYAPQVGARNRRPPSSRSTSRPTRAGTCTRRLCSSGTARAASSCLHVRTRGCSVQQPAVEFLARDLGVGGGNGWWKRVWKKEGVFRLDSQAWYCWIIQCLAYDAARWLEKKHKLYAGNGSPPRCSSLFLFPFSLSLEFNQKVKQTPITIKLNTPSSLLSFY